MQSVEVIKRIGRVSIERCRASIRLRFTLNGKTHTLTVGKDGKEIKDAAIAKAKQIEADIAWNNFDDTLVKYGKQPKNNLATLPIPPIADSEVTIQKVWENYLSIKGDSISQSVIKTYHPLLNKWISLIDPSQLGITHSQIHIDLLKLTYTKHTVSRLFQIVNAAATLAVKSKLIDHNPYSVYRDSLVVSTKGEKSRKPFEDYEVPIILDAFKSDRFVHPNSVYKHSQYYAFVLCLALTGARPEDIIALTFDDILTNNSRKVLRISKAYTHGELKGTKTETIRMFPINQQLQDCLNLAPIYRNKKGGKLLFPSIKGEYLDLHNFTQRYFTPIVKKLVELGEIENQLPTYHLRHTFITQMIRKGIDIATIANLVGNSPETILSNYLGADKGIELPELF
jgi:integrase